MAERLGNYRLLRHLATGGMGEVWLAEAEAEAQAHLRTPDGLRRRVVVKRLLRHLASDPGFVDMFVTEARIAARIAHPNVAQIIELAHEDGSYFLAMEYVRGQSVRELLKKGAIPLPAAVLVAASVLRGLHAAHTLVDEQGAPAGCVHRDVSAENVLLSVEGAVKLVDFGIAKALDASTARGTALRGKYGYMAPEQYERAHLDARTDIFACGVLLFELATGAKPFAGANEAAVMSAVLHSAPPPLGSVVPCPPRLEEIVAHALAKSPDDRFADAETMACELEGVLAEAPGLAEANAALRAFARAEVDAPSDDEAEPAAPRRTAGLTAELGHDTTVVDPEPARVHAGGTRRRAAIAAGGVAGAAAIAFAIHARTPRPGPVAAAEAPAVSAEPTASALATEAPPASTPAMTEPPLPATAKRSGPARRSAAADRGVGTVEFRIRPWAEIFVDGRSVGLSPIAPIELPAGRHHVVFRNKSLDKERAVTTNVVRGETTTVRVDLME